MKRAIILLISGIVLIISIFLIAFYSWSYFNLRKPKVDLSTLEIVLSDTGKINLTEQAPTADSEVKSITPYKFKVANKGDVSTKYQVLLEDVISDNATTVLNRNFLKYELTQDGIVVKNGDLSSIKNNILDENTISAKEEKNYELRIWVKNNQPTSEWVGKTYSYNVRVNPVLN